MQHADWPQVREIYLEGLATGKASFETEAPDWEHWDQKHLPECRLVARRGAEVLGWVALIAASSRPCYAGVAEVSIYVADAARGKGLGSLLMKEATARSEALGFWTLFASIFVENTASKTLFMNHGFRAVGIREKIARSQGVWHDTLMLERRSQTVGVD